MTISNSGSSSWASVPPEATPASPAEPAAQPEPAAQAEPAASEDWQATRTQTQLVRNVEDYLATEEREIGRRVGENQHELFVSCDPGPAMQQQFQRWRPEFIALHDVATRSSRKLLVAIAAAGKQPLQKLVIRRQGHGIALATLEFVELPTAEGGVLRLYSTEADADTTSRHALARTLLGFSMLGVILVGDLPGHSIAGTFKPLHDDMMAGPWPNRHLLLLPLSAANALVTQGMELSRGTGVTVRTTPQVTKPADAWTFISSTWTRLRNELQPAGPRTASPAYPPSEPLALRPMPAVRPLGPSAPTEQDLLSRYVHQLSELTGMITCCVFELATGRAVAHAGASPGPTELAEHGSDLLDSMLSASRSLGLGNALPDAAITLGSHHLVLRPVPKHPTLALHAVLDKTHANLTLARLQIMRMDALFDEPAAG